MSRTSSNKIEEKGKRKKKEKEMKKKRANSKCIRSCLYLYKLDQHDLCNANLPKPVVVGGTDYKIIIIKIKNNQEK